MIVKLLTEHYLVFVSLKGGYTGPSTCKSFQNATLLEITCHDSTLFNNGPSLGRSNSA